MVCALQKLFYATARILLPPIYSVIFVAFHALHVEVKHLEKEEGEGKSSGQRDLGDFKLDCFLTQFLLSNSSKKLSSERKENVGLSGILDQCH